MSAAATLPSAPTWLVGANAATPDGLLDSAALRRETGLTYRQLDYTIRELGWVCGGTGSKRVFDPAWLPVFKRLAALFAIRNQLRDVAGCWTLACELDDVAVATVSDLVMGEVA